MEEEKQIDNISITRVSDEAYEERENELVNDFQIMVVGDSKVGKTSLVERYCVSKV